MNPNVPIVLLHGWNLSAEYFNDVKRMLEEKNYRVIALDLPGFGKQPEPKKILDLSSYVDFLASELSRRRLKKVTIVGHSFGGRIGIKYAAQFPDQVENLVLTGVPVIPTTSIIKKIFFYLIAKSGKRILSLPLLSHLSFFSRWLLYKIAREGDFYNASGVMRETLKNIIHEDLVQYVLHIQAKVLLLWGADDTVTPVSIAEKTKKMLSPNGELVIVPGVGHMLPTRKPDIFTRQLLKFIKQR